MRERVEWLPGRRERGEGRMTRPTLREVFGRSRVLLPVVHPLSPTAALQAVDVARGAGADGVFLINQGATALEVLGLVDEVAGRHPDLWIGVNLLGVAPARVLELVRGQAVRGVWFDSATGLELGVDDEATRPLLFGGVAFKYQAPVPAHEMPAHAREARRRGVDVVTTSGEGTGEAASLDKVRAVRAGLDGHPLGLASGVTPENVGDYLPVVEAFLVATGIESAFGVLDPDKTRRLAERIHAG